MIKVNGLTKTFGDFTAVDDLSFEVERGEVLGFLGPNGAGKSTSMKMIAGFLAPTAGSVSIYGHNVAEHPIAAKRQIGYLPEGAPLYPEMTPFRFLNFIADVRCLAGQNRRLRIDSVVAKLHLEPVLYQPIETLSKGFKRRVGLAQAILHDPKVLILDEPTDGLDPNQKFEVRGLIEDIAQDKIIVISTHILEEVHAVCTRAIIIARGKLLADDTPSALEAQSHLHQAVRLSFKLSEQLEPARQKLSGLGYVDAVEVDKHDRSLTVVPKNGQAIWDLVNDMVRKEQWSIDSAQLLRGQLDEVFRNITMGAQARTH